MKVSIITAAFNNVEFIEHCINSVLSQDYDDIEHIIIDGGSKDGTLDVINKYDEHISMWVSEPDEGIYYALNKGIALAGGDIIGFLHADDFYAHDNVISSIVARMTKHNVDSCYGDLEYVSRNNTDKMIRYWKSCPFDKELFLRGWMPPHPTFFVKKHIYERHGHFNTDFKIAADYELMIRFLEKGNVSTCYINDVLVKMRVGGSSNRSLNNMIIKSSEDYKARKINGLKGGLYTILLKNLSKLPQFIKR
jgi:glycosyltransferase